MNGQQIYKHKLTRSGRVQGEWNTENGQAHMFSLSRISWSQGQKLDAELDVHWSDSTAHLHC